MNKEQFETIGAFKLLSRLDESNTVQIGIKDVKVINEYITNLQNENELLKMQMESNDILVLIEKTRILKQRDSYKERIDKAIDLLKRYNDDENNYYVPVDKAIEILQGGDE